MKNKRGSGPKGARKGKGFSLSEDPFFDNESKGRRKKAKADDFVQSSDSDEDFFGGSDKGDGAEEKDDDDVMVEETADETRKRLAIAHLDKLREIAKRAKEEDDEEGGGGESGKESEEGERDSLVAQILQQKQLEESGRVRRSIASR